MLFVRGIIYVGVIGLVLFSPILPLNIHPPVEATHKSSNIHITLISPIQEKPKKVEKEKKSIQKKIEKKVTKPPVLKKPTKKHIKVVKKHKVVKKTVLKPLKKEEKKVLVPEKKIVKKKVIKQKSIQPKTEKPVSAYAQKAQSYNKEIQKKYFHSVYKLVEEHKKFPKKAKRFQKEGSVKVGFTILHNGTFNNFHIIKKAKYSTFNKSVVKLFRNIDSFLPPPKEVQTPLNIEITISYKLH